MNQQTKKCVKEHHVKKSFCVPAALSVLTNSMSSCRHFLLISSCQTKKMGWVVNEKGEGKHLWM